jgi:pheromone a factor receptor
MVFLLVVPYSVYPFGLFVYETVNTGYDAEWAAFHGNRRNIIVKFPSGGQVHMDKWAQVVLGYVVFLLFGTGTDAHNTYRKMLLVLGLGRIFPSLYAMRESGISTPPSFISARTFTSSCISKAKSYLSKGDSRLSSFGESTFNNSVRSNSIALDTLYKTHTQSISSTSPVLPERTSPANLSFFKRIFTRSTRHQPILPLFSQRSTTSANDAKKAVVETAEGFSARAWATEAPTSRRNSEPIGVVVFCEVKLDEEVRESTERKSADE